ncbi:MAG: phospholipase family protein [Herbaspirillum sp.]|jgi:phosphatidylserine/phosphatidylglycerophosphate/cardiolipin synthase-like enzyme|nr:phospholipase family protein [Herbaspirillum sp.]
MARRYCCVVAWAISLWLAFGLPAGAYETALPAPAQGTLQAAFSPWDDVEGLIVGALADAHSEILVQAYLLTSKKIVGALRQAQQRGVTVKILLDAAQVAAMPAAQKQQAILRNDGIAVWGETNYTNAHNKVIVIDAETADATLITGSYNFTWSAQHKNAENILIVRGNPQLTGLYAANWERHRRDAVSYE